MCCDDTQTNVMLLKFSWPFKEGASQVARKVVTAPDGTSQAQPMVGRPVCETRPTCQIWQKKMAPLSFTAFTIGFHASHCSFVKIPGVWGYLRKMGIPQQQSKYGNMPSLHDGTHVSILKTMPIWQDTIAYGYVTQDGIQR
jgi:hypothetical protein